jgi:hypothetical protein
LSSVEGVGAEDMVCVEDVVMKLLMWERKKVVWVVMWIRVR